VATDRQIAANRANAKRSTGPKSPEGRLKASRNAYRHGLSFPIVLDSESSPQLDVIVAAVVDPDPSGDQLLAAREFALAQLDLSRIRKVRAGLLAKIDQAGDGSKLQRLVAMDRYERFALTKWRRAVDKLSWLSES
jgi:hypothetical protein